MAKVSKEKNTPIRILQVGMHDKIGGVECFLKNYYELIDQNKIQFDFINAYDKLCFENEIKKMGAKIFKISNLKKNPIKYYLELKKVIKENDYQIVHFNMLSAANILPLLAARRLKVKTIIAHAHCNGVTGSFIKRILNRINKIFIKKLSNNYLACSSSAANWMFGKEKNVKILHNAVDYNNFLFNEKSRKKYRDIIGVNEEFVIGHVGRFSDAKNHPFIIEVFKKLLEKNDNIKLLLIGEGELENEVKDIIKKYQIENKVIILSPKNDIYNYYQCIDYFIFPSKYEGLGMSLIEAQISGLNCLASTNVPKEANILGKVKYLSLDEDIECWVEEINKNINSKNNRIVDKNAISSSGYDINSEVKVLEKIYEGEINEKN